MKVKKTPQRTCLGCGIKGDKGAFIRIVRRPDGTLALDARGKEPGRGAYICPSLQCLQTAIKRKAVERALGVRPDADMIKELTEQLEES